MTFKYKFLLFEVVQQSDGHFVAAYKGKTLISSIGSIECLHEESVEQQVIEYLDKTYHGFQHRHDVVKFIKCQLQLDTENSFASTLTFAKLAWIQSVINEYQKYQST